MSEIHRAQTFARAVASNMMRLRGYTEALLPPLKVVDDVYETMGRWEEEYAKGFATDEDPATVAERIQNLEWEDEFFPGGGEQER